jgi:hypothetical protein
MMDPAGEAGSGALKHDFDRRVMLRFHGSGDHLRLRIAGVSRT